MTKEEFGEAVLKLLMEKTDFKKPYRHFNWQAQYGSTFDTLYAVGEFKGKKITLKIVPNPSNNYINSPLVVRLWHGDNDLVCRAIKYNSYELSFLQTLIKACADYATEQQEKVYREFLDDLGALK